MGVTARGRWDRRRLVARLSRPARPCRRLREAWWVSGRPCAAGRDTPGWHSGLGRMPGAGQDAEPALHATSVTGAGQAVAPAHGGFGLGAKVCQDVSTQTLPSCRASGDGQGHGRVGRAAEGGQGLGQVQSGLRLTRPAPGAPPQRADISPGDTPPQRADSSPGDTRLRLASRDTAEPAGPSFQRSHPRGHQVAGGAVHTQHVPWPQACLPGRGSSR